MTSVYNKLEKQRRNLIRIGEKLSDRFPNIFQEEFKKLKSLPLPCRHKDFQTPLQSPSSVEKTATSYYLSQLPSYSDSEDVDVTS